MSDHLPVLKVRLFGGILSKLRRNSRIIRTQHNDKSNEIVADITLPWRYRYLQR